MGNPYRAAPVPCTQDAAKGYNRRRGSGRAREEREAKAISITENLIRRRLSGKELKDGILYLYNIYGSINDVWEATGIPREQIRDYVKYPRLLPELKELVDDGAVNINAAVKAQDASEDDFGEPDADVAVRLAKEMEPMSGPQRKNVVRQRKENPEKPIEDVIETAKTGARVIQVVATVTQETQSRDSVVCGR